MPEFVFGYGSLVAEHPGCHVARLRSHRRIWGVAMDNDADVPGYKSYRLRADGSRPRVHVAFLDVEPDPFNAVTGICMPVDAHRLRALDDRERNYRRVDMTDAVVGARGRVWVYSGSVAGRGRLRDGLARGRAAVSREYLDDVLAGDRGDRAARGPGRRARGRHGRSEVLDLVRIEIPA